MAQDTFVGEVEAVLAAIEAKIVALDAEVDRLDRELAAAREDNERLAADNGRLAADNGKLQARLKTAEKDLADEKKLHLKMRRKAEAELAATRDLLNEISSQPKWITRCLGKAVKVAQEEKP